MVASVKWGGGSFFYIPPGTNRIPEGFWGVRKKLRRNRNHDSCEKGGTGTEKTGILRIPAGITYLALGRSSPDHPKTHWRCKASVIYCGR
jgi:hypothetical protein